MSRRQPPTARPFRKLRDPRLVRLTRRSPTVAQLTLILLIAGLLWRVLRYGLGFPIWGDEAFVGVNLVKNTFANLIQPLIYGPIVPLIFMWLELAVTRVLGLSEWSLRLVPFVSGVAALLLFWRFAKNVLPRRAALLAIGFLAASFYVVRHTAELKPYASDMLVSLLLTMAAWAVVQEPRRVGRWAVLIGLGVVSLWCSYTAAFVGGAVGLLLTWKLVQGRFRAPWLAGWIAFGLAFGGSALAVYFLYAKPHAEYAARLKEIPMWTLAFPPLGQPWKLPLWLVAIHTGEMFAYPYGGKPPGSIATLILAIIGSVKLWRTRRDLLILLLAPLPVTLVAAAMHAYPYGGSARTSLYMAPAICLLAGLGLFVTMRRFLRGVSLRVALLGTTAGLLIFVLGMMISDTWHPYTSKAVARSRAAVASIAKRTLPGDRWVVFNAADGPVPYAPYLGDWHGVGSQFVFDVLRFSPVPVVWAPPPETVTAEPGHRVWLLAYYAEQKKVDFPDEQWAAYVGTVAQRLGAGRHETLIVKQERAKNEQERAKNEAVEVFQFGP